MLASAKALSMGVASGSVASQSCIAMPRARTTPSGSIHPAGNPVRMKSRMPRETAPLTLATWGATLMVGLRGSAMATTANGLPADARSSRHSKASSGETSAR